MDRETLDQFVATLKRAAIGVAVALAVGLVILTAVWNTVFIYVEPGELAVVISKTGEDPPSGQLLAEPGQKGTLKEVLGEGRHFILPYFYEVETHSLRALNMEIPAGKVGVVTAKVGEDLPPGQILAEPHQKGTWRQVLPPGRHRLNPLGYEVEIVNATVIRPGFVGLVTSLVGDVTDTPFAGAGEQGIREEVLQPGLYYINPRELRVREVEVGLNQVSFLDADQIRFPSEDAFDIRLDATVEWELHPEKVARVISEFGARTEIEDKVLIAQARSIGRLEGSRYKAKGFLLGEGRQQIQEAFTQRLSDTVETKNVTVHTAYIRHIMIPDELLSPIRESFVAQEMERTAQVQQETRRSAAQLQREQALIEQRRQEAHAETAARVLHVRAESERAVAEIEAETRRLVAEKQQEIAQLQAERTRLLGEARAEVEQMLGEARASLFRMQVAAFGGDSDAFVRYSFADSLPPDLDIRLVQTGEGTFWTDLDRATQLDPATARLLQEAQRDR